MSLAVSKEVYRSDIMGVLRAIKDLINAVKAKTDNLPASPAPANEYDTQLDANMSTRAPANEYDTPMARITANVATEAKEDVIDGFHDVPGEDAATDAQMRDVIGKKSDTVGGTSIVALSKVVKAKTDNLPASPAPANEYDTELDANMSTRAPASEYDTEMARITADVATEAKQDTTHGRIGAEYANGNGAPEDDNVRAHIFKTGGMGGGTISKSITYDGSVSYTAFTVTGLVSIRIIGYITVALANHADETKVGTTTDDDGFIVATGGAAMQTVNTIWIDNTPAKFKSTLPAPSLIGDGEDVTVIGTANLDAGTVVLYAIWTPISDDGNVVAA